MPYMSAGTPIHMSLRKVDPCNVLATLPPEKTLDRIFPGSEQPHCSSLKGRTYANTMIMAIARHILLWKRAGVKLGGGSAAVCCLS